MEHLDFFAFGVDAFNLIFEIFTEGGECDTEEILHEIPGKFQPFVGVMVFVILLSFPQCELQDGHAHAGHEDSLW